MLEPRIAALALLALMAHCSRAAPPPLPGGFENRRVLESWMAAYGAAPEPGRLPALLAFDEAHAVGGHCKSDPTRALFAACVFDAEPRTIATTTTLLLPHLPDEAPELDPAANCLGIALALCAHAECSKHLAALQEARPEQDWWRQVADLVDELGWREPFVAESSEAPNSVLWMRWYAQRAEPALRELLARSEARDAGIGAAEGARALYERMRLHAASDMDFRARLEALSEGRGSRAARDLLAATRSGELPEPAPRPPE